jgi:hypothetical protein
MTVTLAIILGCLTSVWRFYDGADAPHRWAYSSVYAWVMCVTAGLVAVSQAPQRRHQGRAARVHF